MLALNRGKIKMHFLVHNVVPVLIGFLMLIVIIKAYRLLFRQLKHDGVTITELLRDAYYDGNE
jgi:putative effector of murein hydrolase